MSKDNKVVRPFGLRDKVGYMFGDFGNDFTFMLSSIFMLKFYTDVMGISAGVVGVLMMAARFVDAFTDVTMGQIVDRSKPTKDGKFKPWMVLWRFLVSWYSKVDLRTCHIHLKLYG